MQNKTETTSANPQGSRTESTVSEIAKKFNVPESFVRAQFGRNALSIRKEATRIRAGGQNPNDFNPDYLEQRANDYEAKSLKG